MSEVERREFQSEARQLLDLMVHSVYSNKEIFLRELISNASDALDRLRFEALTNKDFEPLARDPHIRIEIDKDARTLTVSDNGIGMSRDEVIRYIGTIAKSGTKEFAQLLREAKETQLPPELIGQFGVGFYSSFMAADKVVMTTRRAGEDAAVKWKSEGDGGYTLEPAERSEPGTTITLWLKPADEEDGLPDFAAEWTIREIVRKYSDYVAYPIKMRIEREEIERDDEGKPKPGGERRKIVEDQTLNSMKAIWTRDPKDVAEDEFKEFYKHISHDWNPPLKWIPFKAEGTLEFRALLYLPERAPLDLFLAGRQSGLHLYVRRVFIMTDCKELIPEYLRFVRGVVDSEDLSLNISREILQQNRQIQMIRRNLAKKILSTLKDMLAKERETYAKFWGEFGRVLKEGVYQDLDNREALLDIALFETTQSSEKTTLAEYIARMPEGQKAIYFMTGQSREAIEHSPHLEAFKTRGFEALLLTDPVDELWAAAPLLYKEKGFQSIAKGDLDLETDDEKKQAEEQRAKQAESLKSLTECLKAKLEKHVKEVRLSKRLTASPACLVGDEMDISPFLEKLLKASGQGAPETKRILEINPDHPIVQSLQALHDRNAADPLLGDYAELLYGQAILAEGGQPPDSHAFSRKLADLMQRAMNPGGA